MAKSLSECQLAGCSISLKRWIDNHASIEMMLACELDDSEIEKQSTSSYAVNSVWREKVTQWCYDVIDHLQEGRFVVYIAMNILDRYCAILSRTVEVDEVTYEVISMTALFLAVRIAGSVDLRLGQLTAMSRGGTRSQDIVIRGTAIIQALNFERQIITPFDFIHAFLELLPNQSMKKQVREAAYYLAEISVCDAVFSACKASEVALASILTATNSMLESDDAKAFSRSLHKAIGITSQTPRIEALCSRLRALYRQSSACRPFGGVHVVGDDEHQENENDVYAQPAGLAHVISSDELDQACTVKTSTGMKRSHSTYFHINESSPPLKRARPNI